MEKFYTKIYLNAKKIKIFHKIQMMTSQKNSFSISFHHLNQMIYFASIKKHRNLYVIVSHHRIFVNMSVQVRTTFVTTFYYNKIMFTYDVWIYCFWVTLPSCKVTEKFLLALSDEIYWKVDLNLSGAQKELLKKLIK